MPLDDARFGRNVEALEKIDKVLDLLATEDRWCKGSLVSLDGRIIATLQAVDGTTLLLPPIRLAIQQVTGQRFRRVEVFNDHRSTTHALVIAVLLRARKNIISGIDEAPVSARPSVTITLGARRLSACRAGLACAAKRSLNVASHERPLGPPVLSKDACAIRF